MKHNLYYGVDPNRATPSARSFFYRDPLSASDLMQVLLVVHDNATTNNRVPSYKLSQLKEVTKRARSLGLGGLKVFTQEIDKSDAEKLAISTENMTIRALNEIRNADADIYVALETCLCPYTQSGSCAIHQQDGHVDVNRTLDLFGEMAVLQAMHGASAVGPAGMISGTVKAARQALNAAGYNWVGVMPHMIFRGPFYHLYRNLMKTDAGGMSRASFQLDPFLWSDIASALREIENEGADSILTEPGLFILDLVPKLVSLAKKPIGCFSVSGEYELLRHGSNDKSRAMTGIAEYCRAAKRAGASFVATYAAIELAEAMMDGVLYHAN